MAVRRSLVRPTPAKAFDLNDLVDPIDGSFIKNRSISRYVSTARGEEENDLKKTHARLADTEKSLRKATATHNKFLKELGLPLLP